MLNVLFFFQPKRLQQPLELDDGDGDGRITSVPASNTRKLEVQQYVPRGQRLIS